MILAVIVNLFGVPGAGKSTGMSYIFSRLKMNDVNSEMATEFAKDKVWEESKAVFENQAYIFGKQYFKISRVQDKVDVVVTDSPLLLSVFYNNNPILGKSFNETVFNIFNSYDNMNYLLLRNKKYNPNGRFQTEQQSDALKQPFIDLLESYNLKYTTKFGDIKDYDEIVCDIMKKLGR